MEIHPSARKHGIVDADIVHAVEYHLYGADVGDEDERQPRRVLYLGPDRAANLLEVVVLEHDDGTESAIHAMVMREAYERLLPGQEMDRER